MLRIHSSDDTIVYPLQLEADKKYVTHKQNGIDTMQFEIDSTDDIYKHIEEEVIVDDQVNEYVIKNIDEHSDFITIDCEINLNDWKNKVWSEFRAVRQTLTAAISAILPDGWSVVGSGQFTDVYSVTGSNSSYMKAVTTYEILEEIQDVWAVTFQFNCLKKILTCLNIADYGPSGEFVAEDINLSDLGFVGNSDSFATRIYPYGKRDSEGLNPLTIASVNNGKEYLEDNSFSDKVICFGWSDERYILPEDLKEAAALKLAQVSTPSRSYSCTVKELGMKISMHMIITLLDERRNLRVNHRIVEWKEYEDHTLDSITLNSTSEDLSSQLDAISKAQDEQNNTNQEIQDSVDKVTQYTLKYTLEFGELTGNGTFFFTRSYTDKPYFMTKPYDENISISFIQDASTKAYIGAMLSGVSDTQITFMTFYCTMPDKDIES